MKKITKKMSMAEVMKKYPESAEILMQEGLGCMGCPMAMMETVEEGCLSHGLDPDKIIEKINKKVK